MTFRLGDTEEVQAPVATGSQTATSVGSAVNAAGTALRGKLAQVAGVPVERLDLRGDRVKALFKKGEPFMEAEANSKPGDEQDRYSMYAFGANFTEVRVDGSLGRIKVSQMLGVYGAGRILNARTGRSQFLGGMVWWIGLALYEQGVMDARLGRFVNHNLAEYYIPANADIPEIEAVWVDEIDTHVNPLGIKGIGEIGITGSAASVANAVFHATGKRVRDYPITLNQLL